MSLTKIVVPILDSRDVDTREFDNVEVYSGKIEDEIAPPVAPACFPGAWYRKVVSSKDNWLGIEGVITLGEFTPDGARFNLDGKGRYMDNPSVYMGGKSLHESDAGLGYNIMYPDADTSYELDYSTPKLGYRPFWRYIYKDAIDIGGNVNRREVNSWNISNPRSFCYYYFPGDTIRMSVYSPLPNYLQLRIQLVKPTEIHKYVEIRKRYNLKDDLPLDFYSPIFYSEGHGVQKAEFKRVNSIDQYGNEGFNAKPTNASMSKATWHEVYLYRRINGKLVKVPFTEDRYASNICPSEKAITVEYENVNKEIGGENITIHPGLYRSCNK